MNSNSTISNNKIMPDKKIAAIDATKKYISSLISFTDSLDNLEEFIPEPGIITREQTIILKNIPDNIISYNDYFKNPPPLERITTSCGKHCIPLSEQLDDVSNSKEEIILEAYKQELLVCPGLKFNPDHYSGLLFDAIYLTHLREDIREHLIQKLPFPELIRQTNEIPLDLDVMPAENPVFKRMDSSQHYNN